MVSDAVGTVHWITGAGSGIGRAVAATVPSGSRVALSGRREAALRETADLVKAAGSEALVLPLDVGDAASVHAAHERIAAEWGRVDAVVAAAGMNSSRRFWGTQTMAEFDAIVSTNLNGVAYVVDAVLPPMRAARAGRIVVISSYAGWHTSTSPGVAYSASKRALSVLTATVNADGTVRIDGADGSSVDGALALVDEGDCGDSYNYGPVDAASAVAAYRANTRVKTTALTTASPPKPMSSQSRP